ncbi:potassium-transporting ATPase subunit KdpC [Agromyces italicus]|uniref:potassium-transporting ATPase subunit KdpC n=1 Tax=Agromyces italicus TaxID=279572 RepID=UPI0003B78782|nr:potassium-transporting ATPase subunit KdpC [Agromyces italicus]
MSSTRTAARTHWVAIRAMLIFTAVLGVAYTLVITGIGQLVLPAQANASVVHDADGEVVGSALIGQPFTDADGEPLPEWFQPRPSAAGDGYDGGASSGSNWGPENADLIAAIEERKAAIAEFNGVDEADVPADAVTASSSGLDPHISPEYALLQAARVAEARGLDEREVRDLVETSTQARDLGYLGEPTVNVLQLNLALAEL